MYNQADIIEVLQHIPWFLNLKPSQLRQLAAISTIQTFRKGEVIFHEGESLETLYVVIEGEVEIYSQIPSYGRLHILTAEPLDIFGWSALTPIVRHRTGSSVGAESGSLLCLDAKELITLCNQDHTIGYVIMDRVANVAASRFLATKLKLMDVIVRSSHPAVQD